MSIRLKLTIIFLVMVSIPLLFVSVTSFDNYQHSMEEAHLTRLEDLTRFKAERIEAVFARLKAEIVMAQSFYNIRKHLPILIRFYDEPGNPGAVAAKKAFDGQFQTMQKIMGLSDIMLADANGRIVYASNPGHSGKDFFSFLPEREQQAFKEAKHGVYFSDIFLNRMQGNQFEMLMTAPALDFNDVPMGIIAFEVDMAPIYGLIQDTTGLGRTGEVLIGKMEGNEILYLNPLRHDPEAALKRRALIGGKIGLPMQQAVQGRIGSSQSIDYRGEKVVAAWRPIPFLGWGLVAKIDVKEAFADVTNLKRMVIMILAVVLAMVVVVTFSAAQSISQPIKMLTKGAEIIGSGNLDYKVGTNLKDEIGQLSRSFDRMTHDLKVITASRDDLNREITERKRAEEELKRSNENLEQFAYVASHDLQEPLRTMASFSQLLESRYKSKLGNDATDFIGFIVDAAGRMQKLITDLLAYSRIGKAGAAKGKVDCNAALATVVAGLGRQIEESGAVITHDNLPVSAYNESELVQLFQNLVGNAVKFRGAEPPRIYISAERKDSSWMFSVRDNGIGIEDRFKERVFLIFRRLHGRDKYPGTGIGLAICKKIVETRGGRIWVESTPGKGSTFYFTIPDKTKEEA